MTEETYRAIQCDLLDEALKVVPDYTPEGKAAIERYRSNPTPSDDVEERPAVAQSFSALTALTASTGLVFLGLGSVANGAMGVTAAASLGFLAPHAMLLIAGGVMLVSIAVIEGVFHQNFSSGGGFNFFGAMSEGEKLDAVDGVALKM